MEAFEKASPEEQQNLILKSCRAFLRDLQDNHSLIPPYLLTSIEAQCFAKIIATCREFRQLLRRAHSDMAKTNQEKALLIVYRLFFLLFMCPVLFATDAYINDFNDGTWACYPSSWPLRLTRLLPTEGTTLDSQGRLFLFTLARVS